MRVVCSLYYADALEDEGKQRWGGSPKNQREISRGKVPVVGGREEEGKGWGVILVKLYWYIVSMYKYVAVDPFHVYNYHAPIKMWKKSFR